MIGHLPYYRGWLGSPLDETTSLDIDVRYDVYNIFVRDVDGTDTIILEHITDWPKIGQKVKIKQGDTYGNREFFQGWRDPLPKTFPYTAGLSTLY